MWLLVEGPERVMVGEETRFRITLENRGERQHDSIRVEGPFLPWEAPLAFPARPPARGGSCER